MIKNNEALSMAEAMKLVKDFKVENPEIVGFSKKFIEIKPSDAVEMREKIQGLDLLKVKTEHIAKIIDLLPEDKEDLNKIFIDVSLDEDESKKILDVVKEYK